MTSPVPEDNIVVTLSRDNAKLVSMAIGFTTCVAFSPAALAALLLSGNESAIISFQAFLNRLTEDDLSNEAGARKKALALIQLAKVLAGDPTTSKIGG